MLRLAYLAILIAAFSTAFAQNGNKPEPAYKRFPTVPPFRLILPDSTTYFTKDDLSKKKAVMIMLFSPDCDHCQHETEDIIKNIRSFEKVQIVMTTHVPFDKMREFYRKYNLERFDNIVVGSEAKFMLPTFYDIRNFPFLAFYNKKKELISVFEGAMPIKKILEELRK